MTKSLRGAANIKKFNDEREQQALALIKSELAKCKKHKMVFRSLGALAEYLGAITNIHRTTLMRNPRYKSLLAEHSGIPETQWAAVRDEDAPPEVLRARMLALKLENSNLQDKLKRLETYIQRKEEVPALSAPAEGVLPAPGGSNADYLAFVDTAMALTALLERLKDSMVINFERKSIVDLSARTSQRVVIGPERATAYLEWLQQQKHLLLGLADGNQ
ncbi:hypothetical protein METUNv1_01586 [Methyloversatilis universalis FAM5]|uniref:Uncharacterized protein n=1 Tax=Methyloversatilis universalis (strain ATCC BAA-1314 / DSM 25237 / JCM 13912 / CCUG 52030 / FAM5) TaxID=1000565 RepID=F5RBE3_METUF|nr:hypothetical protein [Methyloversatilis universalis]EGK72114.1 hypothetical protein METUNv1_01586 [Methyloversatilis universalis FAM5]